VIDAALARRIRLLALDVDGVLTDNAIFIGPVAGQRVELKRFDSQDGLGMGLLRGTSIAVAWVSGRVSEATTLRADELRIGSVIQDAGARKVPAIDDLLAARGIGWDQVAYVGDDLADLAVMTRVGLPIAVANAVAEVKAVARLITARAGGHGAVREAIEALLRARGEWESVVAAYVASRSGA
jgi:3-deoxy-D-manno-octulosonate 8-phosphate phosphatase (KDO 8-P phosphatase)